MSPDHLEQPRRTTLSTDDPADGTPAETQQTTEPAASVGADTPDAAKPTTGPAGTATGPADTATEPAATTAASATTTEPAETADAPDGTGRRHPVRRVVFTTLACLLVFAALVAPNELAEFTLGAFLRIPVEALVGAALLLILPPKPRRIVAIVLGVLLGLVTVVKLLDIGFFIALEKPFDLLGDWAFFQPGYNFLIGAVGHVGAVIVAILVIIAAIALVLVMGLAVGRLARIAGSHRIAVTRTTAVLAVIWLVCAFTGVQFAPGQPFAARADATLAADNARQVSADIADQRQFDQQLATDPINSIPSADLLTGLRGKNVLLVFVESYGRVAVQDSFFSPPIDKLLDNGTKQLAADGFQARSGFLTSSTVGGASWLAHSSMQSGLFVSSQQRYESLVNSDRTSLSGAFREAGWQTVGYDASNFAPVPKSTLYPYDKFYDAVNVGYKGPRFSYATMPDQYMFHVFQQKELAQPGHPPVMAEIDLVSSHTPWTPLPRMVDPAKIGDGSIFDPMPAQGPTPSALWQNASQVRASYGQSIQYSLTALVSFVSHAHDDNLVLVLLGDHQPATIVSGSHASHRVPITIVAHDPSVLQRIAGWGWTEGMQPSRTAPVWPMSAFRDRFLKAYSVPAAGH
ncbi:MAG TPA: sulfatase-like hydrolase/transferase [Pseudonocardiaceae bacterium]|nr:sulfatase-like hydrolase/transferase [Pseudonocardiaceae bacterium]